MNNLFEDFKSQSAKDWEEKIIADLKGKDFNSLISKDGVSPFYHQEIVNQNPPISKETTWHTCQFIDSTNTKKANEKALLALSNDVSTLCFSNPNNLEILLKDISIEHIRIDFKNYTPDFVKKWADFIKNKTVNGAFHGIENFSHPTFCSTIFAKGKTAKEQIKDAFDKGKKEKGNIQFHFFIGENYLGKSLADWYMLKSYVSSFYPFTLSRYAPLTVSILILSPSFIKRGT